MQHPDQRFQNSEATHRITGNYWSGDGPGPRVMAADTLAGDEVKNLDGDHLGTIQNIVLDVVSGRIAYAVMTFGGIMGMGEKLFAIPWMALTLDADDRCFVMDIDKNQMENAPGFDKHQWPSMADERWARTVHDYYDARPYWD